MGEEISQWLVGEFAVFGVHFQNWMPIAVAIVLLCIVYQWIRGFNR
jgi:hypothetical protein